MDKLLARNIGNPSGWFGRLLVRVMNVEHSELTDWGLRQTPIGQRDTILDVGCGGGRTIQKLAEMAASGRVFGIDISEQSVAVSRRANRRLIETGRAEIARSAVSSLPFPDHTFDLVTAVETHYFWPDLIGGMREILRVLKPGGHILIVGEIYRGGRYDDRNQRFGERMNLAYQSVGELGGLLSMAGYSEIRVLEEYDRGWICGIGRRPEQASDESASR